MSFFDLVRLLPALISLVMQFLQLVKSKGLKSIGQVGQALDLLQRADTHDEHVAAAQVLAKALSGV